jgi:hypothetical protein
MCVSIYFNRQSRSVTVEIHDKTIYHLLSPEVKAVQLVVSQLLPECLFRRRHVATHPPRNRLLLRLYPLTSNYPAWAFMCWHF